MPRFSMIKQMSESKAVIGLNMLTLWKDRGTLQPWIGPLQEMLDDGTVKPVVAGDFSFEDAGAAQTMITERRNVGKVVVVPEAAVTVRCHPSRRVLRCESNVVSYLASLASPAPPSGGIARGGRVAAYPAERTDRRSASKRDREGARAT
jgi:hypothetical protein